MQVTLLRSFSNDIPEFTVTEITGVLQRFMQETFYSIKVRGEISGLSRPNSGHVYFTLKDSNSVINAVCWNGTRLKVQFCDGLEVVCTGYLSVYQSKYQLIVTDMTLAGYGKLAAMLAELKKKLELEGLFSPARKKKLPFLPTKIGVITSPTGAVISDIISRVKQRFPSNVVVWPVQVQGDRASAMVIEAIKGFNSFADPPHVIIVARGGGSFEDLWPFNDEELARTVAASKIPIVSAIGHETDFTIIDYAADLRASTPTAAVELVLPEKSKLVASINEKFVRTKISFERIVKMQEYRLLRLYGILTEKKNSLLQKSRVALEYQQKIRYLLQVSLLRKRQYLESLMQRLSYYDSKHILGVGYAIVRDEHEKQISSVEALSTNDTITIELKDGKRRAIII
ncbi:Exodeoxyribonuclease 7 large subunit [Anaplasma phagocytophilum]|uniref:Exodeoxyribonuclease 7 large subunit n=2 Tax=Anaplasma phagocytophilum TaxID=948 RepID=A0A7H9E015_ANAPH|nr:exodeoxyribonuclease VII large subunit [Anaplasma phagocytophilum]QLL67154.1 exodeoxyribonuclease VII large subunit [Anaplasma phagocytophilum str. Norway variant1]SCV62973.1 Exodeoxyribonuclease 7 large subunit [Anaplasma phagocytophilum]